MTTPVAAAMLGKPASDNARKVVDDATAAERYSTTLQTRVSVKMNGARNSVTSAERLPLHAFQGFSGLASIP